jgi:hypothetical protein
MIRLKNSLESLFPQTEVNPDVLATWPKVTGRDPSKFAGETKMLPHSPMSLLNFGTFISGFNTIGTRFDGIDESFH